MKVPSLAAACATALTSTCYGQLTGYNIDFGRNAASAPDAAFGGAAGQPGYWNTLATGSDQDPILDIHSADVGATCSVSGGYPALNYNHSATSGNLQKLLDDFQDTDADRGDITVTLDGLEPGDYLVFTYALAPDGSSYRTLVNVLESTEGSEEVGGAFQTGLVAGVTHSIHFANVGVNQQLTIIASTAAQYASINGVQIVPLTGLTGAFGQAGGDQFGRAVACIGDIDGDAADDFVVGAPYNDEQGANAGKVYVYSGLAHEIIHSINGEAAGDQFGSALAGAGDVNGDGTPDFIVGAPFSNLAANDAGKVNVYSGVDFAVIYSKVGSSAGDRFGQAVAGGVDVNDDGQYDFFVGAPESKSKDGQLYVFSGATGQKLKVIKGDAGDKLGWSIAPLPKANNDTHGDFAVSSPWNDDAGSNAGKVSVYSGKDFTMLYDLHGENSGDQFGLSVACARRANSDDRDDLIIGSPFYDTSGKSNRGRIEAFSGKNGSSLWSKIGSMAGDRLGAVVAGVGDVNGDGHEDIAASATYHDGAGTDAGRVQVRSGLSGSSIANINGEAVGDRFALALAGLQNPSGNGSNSVLAGAPRNDFSGLSSGKIYIVSLIDAAQAPSPDGGALDQLMPIKKELAPGANLANQSSNSSESGFCPGDLNLDAVVDDADLIALIEFWGACDLCPEDLNGDDTIDSADLIVLVNNWGACP